MPWRIAWVPRTAGRSRRRRRVGPGGDKEGDLPPTVGEVDVNVTEVGLEALAGEMPQGDEGLTVRAVVLAEIALYLAVTAVVSVLVTEAAKDLRRGMPLLGGSILVVGQDLVDDGLKRPQHGRVLILGLGTGSGCLRTYRIVFRE